MLKINFNKKSCDEYSNIFKHEICYCNQYVEYFALISRKYTHVN